MNEYLIFKNYKISKNKMIKMIKIEIDKVSSRLENCQKVQFN